MHQLGIAILIGGATLHGCAGGQDSRQPPPSTGRETDRPLYSAAEPLALSTWWTNGRSLLHLRTEGGYELFPGLNRYEQPRERGQWTKRSYVALEFEPYAVHNRSVERITLDRDSKGGLVLLLRDDPPFVPIERPPQVMEDSLFGSWLSADYQLTLGRNMTYRYRVRSHPALGSAALAGHEGSWSMRGISEIILQPAAPGLAPLVLHVTGGRDVTIEGAERLSDLPSLSR